MDDQAIIRGILAGRTDDFAILVERHQRMIHAVAQRYLDDVDAADEVTQATFVRAFSSLARFRGAGSFRTWLCAIALNQCRALARRKRARRLLRLDDVPESALPAVEPAAPAAWLERMVTRLPPRQRAVLTLRLIAELPFREIARLEGITENSAKVSFHHAVKRLRRWLADS